MRVVLPDVVAVRSLVRVIAVDQLQRRHVLLSVHVAVAARQFGAVAEGGAVRAGERVGQLELIDERLPDQQVLVAAARQALLHLLRGAHAHRRVGAVVSVVGGVGV